MCWFINLIVLMLFCTKLHSKMIESTTTEVVQLTGMGRGLAGIVRGSTRIKKLNLAYNHITTLPAYVFHNNSYRALNQIDLYQNKITSMDLAAFRGLRQLKIVDLSYNNLTAIDPHTFKFNNKLEKLDLSNNRISFDRLQIFLITESLETLVLINNRIEQIFETTFMGLPNLQNLMLDFNILLVVSSNSFSSLDRLQYLSLANTGVHRLSASMFGKGLPRTVDLTETPLSKRFDPALKKVSENAVKSLISLDKYMFASDES